MYVYSTILNDSSWQVSRCAHVMQLHFSICVTFSYYTIQKASDFPAKPISIVSLRKQLVEDPTEKHEEDKENNFATACYPESQQTVTINVHLHGQLASTCGMLRHVDVTHERHTCHDVSRDIHPYAVMCMTKIFNNSKTVKGPAGMDLVVGLLENSCSKANAVETETY